MKPNGIQALLVITDPLCVYAGDVVDDGVTNEVEVAARVAERLNVSTERAAGVVDGLVGIGWIARTGLGRVGPISLESSHAWLQAGVDQVSWLRSVGEEEHARDCIGAIYAAWDTRSSDPVRRRRGAHYRLTESWWRFRDRLDDGTVGQVAAPASRPA